ncbi:transcriptional regulator, TENA/THI-4 family protein [Cryobacterium sp. Hz7]|uniref:TenA family protein n=1 Tax=Cryobacterium sp. Hz7 TaxID=1259166 RepID=UPI0010695192|nr:TenA family protein [Cryobacterium sp. Hz7]TFB59000.1 transcriptional regulator, TENA/THI-4 family protein [Cryobacterium sp. Hz7]
MTDAHRFAPGIATITVDPNGHIAELRAAVAEAWDAAVDHRFVRELSAGAIDDEVLIGYLVQDHQFFDAFLSMLGACVAYGDEVPAKRRLARQLGMLASDEEGYFQQSFDELGVPKSERTAPELTPATTAFRQVMTEATRSQSYPHLLVILVIAEWLYLDWGEREAQMPERFVHREWIDLHRGTDFQEWVQFLLDELDRVFPQDSAERDRLTAVWEHVVDLELAFFDTAYA